MKIQCFFRDFLCFCIASDAINDFLSFSSLALNFLHDAADSSGILNATGDAFASIEDCKAKLQTLCGSDGWYDYSTLPQE